MSDDTVRSTASKEENTSASRSDTPGVTREKSDRGRADWFGRVFSQGFTPEDLVLYALSFVLIIAFAVIFVDLQRREERLIQSVSDSVVEHWQPPSPNENDVLDLFEMDMNFIRAQVTGLAMLYQQGSISTAAISTRKNLGFLVGTIIAIIGCVTVIRGVRQSPIKFEGSVSDKAQVALATSSPGVFVVLMGAIIIVSTIITSGERPELKFGGFAYPRPVVNVMATPTAGVVEPTTTATATPFPTSP